MLRLFMPILALAISGCAKPMSPPDFPPVADYGTGVPLNRLVWLQEPYTTIIVDEVLEDSRCPADVQCVWKGQVRVRARIGRDETPGTLYTHERNLTFEEEVTLDEPFFLFGGHITLEGVSPPPPKQGEAIALEDYRFTFSFEPKVSAN